MNTERPIFAVEARGDGYCTLLLQAPGETRHAIGSLLTSADVTRRILKTLNEHMEWPEESERRSLD